MLGGKRRKLGLRFCVDRFQVNMNWVLTAVVFILELVERRWLSGDVFDIGVDDVGVLSAGQF